MILGELRYNIVVLQPTFTRDENNGSRKPVYTTKYNLKAKIKFNGGSKGVQNEEIFNTATLTFTTHFRKICDSDIILYDGNKYKIMMIGEIGYKEGLEIITEKIHE